MKLWLIIWAIYVLVLSGVPCEAFCPDEQKTAREQGGLPAADDHSHDADCSPFCMCATCPGFALPQPPILSSVTHIVMLPTTVLLSRYLSLHLLDVPGRIWQPPRLG